MRSKKILFTCVLVIGAIAAYGQTSKDVDAPRPPSAQYQSAKPKESLTSKIFKKKPKSDLEDFRERMKEVQKKKIKEEKLSRKPQYSNPLYFGHKKPPKKRPLSKRKLCKECNIVH